MYFALMIHSNLLEYLNNRDMANCTGFGGTHLHDISTPDLVWDSIVGTEDHDARCNYCRCQVQTVVTVLERDSRLYVIARS